MDWSSGDSREHPEQTQQTAVPRYPRIWIGYLLGVATLIAEMVTVSLHPELTKTQLFVPPLYLFLPSFISLVYWLVCVYEFHIVLAHATSGAYPIKPLRAAWFHLIPLFGWFYWPYKWARELARFVNSRPPGSLLKPERTGAAIALAFIVFLVDRGFGMMLLFWAASHLSRSLRLALSARTVQPPGPLPFS